MNAPKGYESLAKVFELAIWQAAHGKGKERHANNLPFHDQRMQTISMLLDSPDGMAYQVIKKTTEGLQFDDHDRRERELLGAINYLAGIVIFYRSNAKCSISNDADWDAGEKRMEAIGRNGNGGEHYPEIGFIDGQGIIEVGDHLPELGGYLIGFNDGCGIIMPVAERREVSYCEAHKHASAINAAADAFCRGFSDWRVPTKDELDLAWINRAKLAGLNLGACTYWAATEHGPDLASCIEFRFGMWDCSHKSSAYRVRFVRSVPMDGW